MGTQFLTLDLLPTRDLPRTITIAFWSLFVFITSEMLRYWAAISYATRLRQRRFP